ncbi:MAG: hypothetical protein IPH68_15670 [Chitinophagaceae bacterium]|nr:hypothetical protein [Chitinophagaceae bacterium]
MGLTEMGPSISFLVNVNGLLPRRISRHTKPSSIINKKNWATLITVITGASIL